MGEPETRATLIQELVETRQRLAISEDGKAAALRLFSATAEQLAQERERNRLNVANADLEVREVRAELELLRGADRAAGERQIAAAQKVGEPPFGCDTADHLADLLLAARAELSQERERNRLNVANADLEVREVHAELERVKELFRLEAAARDSAEARAARLREALEKYGRHDARCGSLRFLGPHPRAHNGKCDCGLDSALAAQKAAGEKKP